MTEHGILQHLERKYKLLDVCAQKRPKREAKAQPITVDEIAVAFCVLAVGLGASALVLWAERILCVLKSSNLLKKHSLAREPKPFLVMMEF